MENVQENKNVWKKVLNIAFYVVLAIVFLYAMFALFSKKEENQISFLGITSLAVQSDSMKPTFEEGDLIFIDKDVNPEDLEIGDVITYEDFMLTDEGTITYYNTHRIVEIDDSGLVIRFTTKGDNNPTNDARRVSENEIIGVWTENSWSNFGSFADGFTGFLKSGLGFFLLIVLPAVAFLVYEVIRFVKVYSEYNNKKHVADRVKMHEDAVREAKRQLEEEQKNKE
ncbi:signal peptidase I [Mycoplasmatota bacterium]|nr:signal peptidase I [Mycoplasmatota bacterium]